MLEHMTRILPPVRYGVDGNDYLSLTDARVISLGETPIHKWFTKPLADLITIVNREHYVEVIRQFPLPRGKALNAAIKFEAQSLQALYQGDVLHYVMRSDDQSVVYFWVLKVPKDATELRVAVPETLLLMLGDSGHHTQWIGEEDGFLIFTDESGIARSLCYCDAVSNPATAILPGEANKISEEDRRERLIAGLKRFNWANIAGLLVRRQNGTAINLQDLKRPALISTALFAVYLGLSSGYLMLREGAIDSSLEALSGDIAEATKIRNETLDIEAQISQLQGVVERGYGVTGLIEMVAGMPRQDLTLKSLKLDGATVEIRGTAPSARAIFEYFSQQNGVATTKFFEPVYKSGNGTENFGLQVVLE